MPFNDISKFKSNLLGEGARGTLFDVSVAFPTADAVAAGRKLTFTCRAAQLPASTVGIIEIPYFGRKVKVAGDRTFAEWTVTVINDEDFLTRNAFETWMSSINSHVGNLRTAVNTTNYQRNATVTQYDKGGFMAKQYNFVNMFPIEVGAIDVAWDQNDQIEEYTVTLQYDWWEARGTTDGNAPAVTTDSTSV